MCERKRIIDSELITCRVRSSINWLKMTTAAPAVSVYDVRSKRNSGSHSASTKDLIMQFSMWEIIDFCFFRALDDKTVRYCIWHRKKQTELKIACRWRKKTQKQFQAVQKKILFHHDVARRPKLVFEFLLCAALRNSTTLDQLIDVNWNLIEWIISPREWYCWA